jgi:hypothetical protein
MKKVLLSLMLMFTVVSPSLADPHHYRGGEVQEREHREWHERGGHFGWGEFVGGIILGGIIAHEVNGHYYDAEEQEVRQVCNDFPVVDAYGHYVYDNWGHLVVEKRCQWVRVNPIGPWP